MTKNELKNQYFEWMYGLVCTGRRFRRRSYRTLFTRLHEAEFTFTIQMDRNRAEDGVDLRYRFGSIKGYSGAIISRYLDDRECSILEMLIALSIRCEEHIMDDPDIGNRTGQWFWNMIGNLGLRSLSDDCFDDVLFSNVIFRFLNHQYEPDGRGGLFTVKNHRYDMRDTDIWYQMCWYLDEIL